MPTPTDSRKLTPALVKKWKGEKCPLCGGTLSIWDDGKVDCKHEPPIHDWHALWERLNNGAAPTAQTNGHKEEPSGSLSLVEYAISKNLPVSHLEHWFGAHEAKHPYYNKVTNAVCFPYWNERGEEVTQQWRWSMVKTPTDKGRAYIAKKPTYLYAGRHLQRLEQMAAQGAGMDTIFLVEGESNTHTLSQRFATLGLPGVGNWQDDWKNLKLFQSAKRIYFLLDMKFENNAWVPEDAAEKGALKVANSFAPGKVLKVKLPCKDASDLWLQHTVDAFGGGADGFLRAMSDAILAATPVKPVVEVLDAQEEQSLAVADMPESVLDGSLGQLCRDRMLADFPIAYAWPALVTAAAALVPNSKVRTNLFTALVGAMGTGKSRAFDRAFKLLGLQEPPLLKLKSGSAEGLADKIGNVNGEARLVYTDELEHLLKKAAIENASFTTVLNTAFYEDVQTLTVRHGKEILLNCRLSILGGVVTERFGDVFGAATTGGFYDRFLFSQFPDGFVYVERPFEGEPANVNVRPVDISPDVWDEVGRWKKELRLGRPAELALRVAVICAALDGRGTLRAADLGPALEFAKYQHRVRELLEPNPGKNQEAQCANRIKNRLKRYAADGRWVLVRELDQATSAGRDFGAGVLMKCLQHMAFNQEVELDLEKPHKVRWLLGKA